MSKAQKWIKDSWDEVVVFLATLAAVIVAPYLGAAAMGSAFHIELNWGYLILGGVVATYLVVRNESRGFDQEDDAKTRQKKREAKRRNLGGRLTVCMGHGFTWPTVIGIAGQAIGAGLKALGA